MGHLTHDMTCGLAIQADWATADGEQDYVRQVQAMIHAGDLGAADAQLARDLETIDLPVAALCRALPADKVVISGWEDMNMSIAAFEGDPITAVHILMSNEADLAFEAKDGVYEPVIESAIYSDTHCAFSTLDRDALLAEVIAPTSQWYGEGEDIEAYLELTGLAELNTALLRHKTQFFLRPGDDEPQVSQAPLPYIEFTLATLFRTLRFHQAVRAELDRHGIAGSVAVIASMDNMRGDIPSVHSAGTVVVAEAAEAPSLVIPIKRNVVVEEEFPSGTTIRRRLAQAHAETDGGGSGGDDATETRGFFQRLFARR